MDMMAMHSGPMALGLHLHVLFGIVFFAGAILFIVWASRLKTDQLKKYVIWALVIGTVGTLLTANVSRWVHKLNDKGLQIEIEEVITPGELS